MDTNMTFRMDSGVKAQMEVSTEKMIADAEQLLSEFAADYKRMAE